MAKQENKDRPAALLIGAHFDDCECGSAAGVAAKLAKMGWRVVFLNTIGDHSGWSFVKDKRMEKRFIRDAHEAARILGAEKVFLPFRHNMLHPCDTKVVSAIAEVIQAVNPTLAFLPWPDDNHYDHARTATASLEALSYTNRFAGGAPVQLKLKEILAYEISSWQTRNFTPDFHVDIGDEIDLVVQSIKAFKELSAKSIEHYVNEKTFRCQHWGLAAYCRSAEGLKHLGPQFPVKSLLSELLGEALRPVGSLQYPWGARFFPGAGG